MLYIIQTNPSTMLYYTDLDPHFVENLIPEDLAPHPLPSPWEVDRNPATKNTKNNVAMLNNQK